MLCLVVCYVVYLFGWGWLFFVYVKDIWISLEWDLCIKFNDVVWGVICIGVNVVYLKDLCDDFSKVELVYYGLDFFGFLNLVEMFFFWDGIGDLVQIVFVGCVVEKKGYDDLLVVMSCFFNDLNWYFIYIGGGELLDQF